MLLRRQILSTVRRCFGASHVRTRKQWMMADGATSTNRVIRVLPAFRLFRVNQPWLDVLAQNPDALGITSVSPIATLYRLTLMILRSQ